MLESRPASGFIVKKKITIVHRTITLASLLLVAACGPGSGTTAVDSPADAVDKSSRKAWEGPLPAEGQGGKRFHMGAAAPDETTVYVPARGGGTTAVRVEDGSVVWTSDSGGIPFLALEEVVFAMQPVPGVHNALRVAGLSSADGSLMFLSKRVTFPDWVHKQPDYGCCTMGMRAFEVAYSAGVLVIGWAAHNRCAGGVGYVLDEGGRWRLTVHLGSAKIDDEALDEHAELPVDPLMTHDLAIGGLTLSVVETYLDQGTALERLARVLQAVDSASGEPAWQLEILEPEPVKVCPM